MSGGGHKNFMTPIQGDVIINTGDNDERPAVIA